MQVNEVIQRLENCKHQAAIAGAVNALGAIELALMTIRGLAQEIERLQAKKEARSE